MKIAERIVLLAQVALTILKRIKVITITRPNTCMPIPYKILMITVLTMLDSSILFCSFPPRIIIVMPFSFFSQSPIIPLINDVNLVQEKSKLILKKFLIALI